MTPMIDILLVLIIIFMVITPLRPVGLDTLIPQPAPPDIASLIEQRSIVIVIDADRHIRTNSEPVQPDHLVTRLREIFRTRAERVVFVQGHRDLEYQAVAEVIDLARSADLDRIGLQTDPVN
jgi:biopolymer transport protein ExbD